MRKYQPSNGTEGEMFHENYCYQCIHERWVHRQDENKEEDKCDIWSAAMIYDLKDPRYPEEWTYENGQPTCTGFKKWDWGNDDDGWNEPPPPPPPEDPNQLVMPFLLEFIEGDFVATKHVIIEREVFEQLL